MKTPSRAERRFSARARPLPRTAMCAARVSPLALLFAGFSLGQLGQAIQVGLPKLQEHTLERPESDAVSAVETVLSASTATHKSNLLEHAQVLGDGGPAHAEVRRDVAGRQFLIPDQAEDLAPAGSGECSESGVVHAHSKARRP